MDARNLAATVLGETIRPGDPLTKVVDEAIEASLVRVAREIVYRTETPTETYQRLIDLYERQPGLNVRSSTSVLQQAYSTPLPLAYLATQLAEIEPGQSVYEPTAGHGALLLSSAANQRPTVNELNPDRAADLRAQGYEVTEYDALQVVPDKPHDAVILNPPFGTQADGQGGNSTFRLGEFLPFQTTQIDQVIALKSLQAMKPDGKAVLILGGKMGVDEEKRSDRYNSREARAFYYTLYENFGVVDHFSVWGDLNKKQGAGFPIDVIVIHGRGKSTRPLPAAEVPRIYRTYEELGELLDVPRRRQFYSRPDERLRATGGWAGAGGAGAVDGNQSERAALSGAAGPASGTADAALASRGGRSPYPEPAGEGSDRPGAAASLSEATESQAMEELGTVSSPGERADSEPSRPLGDRVSRGDRAELGANRVAKGVVRGTGYPAESARMVRGNDARADEQAVAAAPKQIPYQPSSRGRSVGTLVPVNMGTAASQALLRLSRQVGDLDRFVADRLGYGSTDTLHRYFSAEQVDALALAIHNVERGSGFILGDQTGIGKGRVVAGMLRYAKITGRTPIFVTKDTPLYADLIRDLRDIGMEGFKPLVTNAGFTVGLPDGRILKTTAKHQETLRALREEGSLGGYDAIFTTYHQLQTVKGKETERRAFLRQFAAGSLLVLDESHEAGGGTGERDETAGAANRADFTRELVELSAGCLYSSATYAKVPEVMTLYAKTDMRLALANMESLTGLVSSGGIPLQQALAATLTESGQYLRRERSFDGVKFDPMIASVNQEVAENIATIMAEIMEFDRLKRDSVKAIDKDLKAEAKQVMADNSTGGAGATSTNFTSIMHNVIEQMLLALKAEATVQQALQILHRDEKPVIALSNTMGSTIKRYAEDFGLTPGEEMELSFGDLLRRYLERSRDIMEGSAYGEKKLRRLTDSELGAAAVAKFEAIHALIDRTDFSAIPVSPVDYIQGRLRQEGYQTGEVTGREHIAAYQPDGGIRYQRRTNEERSKKTAVETVKAFNEGRLDVILLNRSGSTGISLHASETFRDQRPRHMIVAQAEADINQFMQMLGRVHRTGQVVPPSFTLLMADIPAEKRPGAVLMKKMASLNANTTAARSSGIVLDVPDFLNEYGDRVIEALMASHRDIHERLDYPLDTAEGFSVANPAAKVTGRIPLLPLAEQEALYDLIETAYLEYVRQREALGESVLEASTLNLDAKILARMEILPADAGSASPFTGAVYAELVDAKSPRKPFPTLTVINRVRERLDLAAVDDKSQHHRHQVKALAVERVAAQAASLQAQAVDYKATQPPARWTVIDGQTKGLISNLNRFPIGQSVCLTTDKGETIYGVVEGMTYMGEAKGNPVAPSSWEVRFLVVDTAQRLTFSLSQINTPKVNSIGVEPVTDDGFGHDIYDLFDQRQGQNREKRQIITGNLLRAYETYPGSIVNFSDCHGNMRQGLLTPQEFDAEKFLAEAPVTLPTIEDAWRWISEYHGQLQTSDLCLTLKEHKDGGYVLHTPKPKGEGGKYYLDDRLLEAAGGEFFSIADRMECRVDATQLEAVLTYLLGERNIRLVTKERQDEARKMLGIVLPTLEPFIDIPLPTLPPAAVKMPREEEATTPVPAPAIWPSDPVLPTANPPRGRAEQNIVRLLETGGLTIPKLLEGEDFHLRVENEPYVPLVIERHGDLLYLTHYLEQNGDWYIDSEMVFKIQAQGAIRLIETAVQGLGREHRGCDRGFAAMFSRNLIEQGFGAAIQQQLPPVEPVAQPLTEPFEQLLLLSPSMAPDSADRPLATNPHWEEVERHTAAEKQAVEAPQAIGHHAICVEDVWAWRRATRDLSLDLSRERFLRQLEQQLKERSPLPVSAEVAIAISTDLERYRPYEERGRELLAYAQVILAHAGQSNSHGKVRFQGKNYALLQSGDTLTVTRRIRQKNEVILHTKGDAVLRSTVTAADVERFARVAQPYCLQRLNSGHSIA